MLLSVGLPPLPGFYWYLGIQKIVLMQGIPVCLSLMMDPICNKDKVYSQYILFTSSFNYSRELRLFDHHLAKIENHLCRKGDSRLEGK